MTPPPMARCDGNVMPFESAHTPSINVGAYKRWRAEGTDIVKVLLDATKERGMEAFWTQRMNGSDSL